MSESEGIRLRDVVGQRLQKPGGSSGPDISEVKKKMGDMEAVHQTMETARTLAGTSAYQQQVQEKDEQLRQGREEVSTLKDQLSAAQIDALKGTMEAKMDQLRELVSQGGNKSDIASTIREIREAATELGMGQPANPLTQIHESLALVAALTPKSKTLAEQIQEMNDTKHVLAELAPTPPTEAGSALVSIKLQQVQQEFTLQMERLKMEQLSSDRTWQLAVEELKDSREARRTELEAKIDAGREQSKMIANALEIVGAAIAKAMQEGGIAGAIGSSPLGNAATPVQASTPRQGPVMEAAAEESGSIQCQSCGMEMFLAPDATQVTCPGCAIQYPVQRVAPPTGKDEAWALQ